MRPLMMDMVAVFFSCACSVLQLVQIGAFDLESPLVDVVIDGLSQTTYVESLYTLNTTTNDLRSVFVL